MLFERSYQTIAKPTEAVYTDSKSRFLAFAFPVNNETEVKAQLAQLKAKHPDATHHCYAWILHPDKSAQRVNDDGEPANTAGRPIIKQINSKDLTNILLVVVRFFGGKKLGIPGLIEAYGESAKLCLAQIELVQKTLKDYYKLTTDLDKEHLVYNLARKFSAEIIETSRSETLSFLLSISGSKTESFIKECQLFNNFETEYIKTE